MKLIILITILLGNAIMKQTPIPAGAESALAFLNSLTEQQKVKVINEFNDSRTDWHYFPSTMYKRDGVQIKDLNSTQRDLLNKLLQTYLSQKGYNKTNNIIKLESVLRELEGGSYRDPELYHIVFYGHPLQNKVWGWKFEGHHISLNFTVAGNEISYSPRFFGANPAEVTSGVQKGLRALKEEEDIALELMNAMSSEQQAKALFRKRAYNDILTENDSYVEPLDKEGIQAKELTNEQQILLKKLIMEYVSALPEELAAKRMQQVEESNFSEIYFGWAGEVALHEPHYYRIQGDKFLIELDNTQNNANHIHSVWREFNGDFGRDIIRDHYKNSNHHDH
jgi:hypothetical protein